MSEVLQSLSQTTQQPTEPGDYALVAKLRNVRPLVHLLKAINFKERAQCVITQRGVKFSVEDSRSVQAHAYLQRHFFQHFVFGQGALAHGEAQPEQDQDLEMAFAVQLSTLLQCLTIFAGTPGSATMGNPSHVGHSLANHYDGMGSGGGPNTGLGGTGGSSSTYRSYTSLGWVVNSQGSEVELVLEENEVISVCKLVTLSPEDMANFQFSGYPTVHRLIMRSEALRDALLELDGTSEKVVFQFSPTVPHFSLVTMGANGSAE
ncbi:checkpoint clamp complex protein Rad1, partial [Dispira simplex]